MASTMTQKVRTVDVTRSRRSISNFPHTSRLEYKFAPTWACVILRQPDWPLSTSLIAKKKNRYAFKAFAIRNVG